METRLRYIWRNHAPSNLCVTRTWRAGRVRAAAGRGRAARPDFQLPHPRCEFPRRRRRRRSRGTGGGRRLVLSDIITVHSTARWIVSTMKLLWAVSALLLCCWRANASTGKKNSVSAMLVEDADFALTIHEHVNSCFPKPETGVFLPLLT